MFNFELSLFTLRANESFRFSNVNILINIRESEMLKFLEFIFDWQNATETNLEIH